MRIAKVLVAACLATSALVELASVASAEPFNITPTGKWTAVAPANVVGLEGVNTSRIKWGTPLSINDGGQNEKSSYEFVGNNSLTNLTQAALTDPNGFVLGTFTHYNFTIASEPTPFSITGATLVVNATFQDTGPTPGSINRNFTFNFTHTETPNSASPCPDPDGVPPAPAQPCPDIVSFQSVFSQETVNIGGTNYVLQILGFRVGQNVVTSFLTTEAQRNDALLVARLSIPPRAPEPGTLGILGVGLAALGYYRFRRRRG